MTDNKLVKTLKEEGFEELFNSHFSPIIGTDSLNELVEKANENGYSKIILEGAKPSTSNDYFFEMYGKK